MEDHSIKSPIPICAGTIHVLRLPTRCKKRQSTSGAHSSFKLNGQDCSEYVPISENVQPRSRSIIGTTRPRPIGMPCSVYSTSSSKMFPYSPSKDAAGAVVCGFSTACFFFGVGLGVGVGDTGDLGRAGDFARVRCERGGDLERAGRMSH